MNNYSLIFTFLFVDLFSSNVKTCRTPSQVHGGLFMGRLWDKNNNIPSIPYVILFVVFC